ncbi:MAG: AMP-binding protein [Clostridia bacterium]|nr:AMP-binding protein [Clostridia bacterium]
MAIYEEYIGRDRDSFTSLKQMREEFKITCPDDFNFAYDVMDRLGKEKPNKLALHWVSNNGEEKKFTFADMMKLSNKCANYLKSIGIKKGDKVLIVLKRSYLFWITFLALHKIGAIGIQATHMLMTKDYVYRCQKGEVKAVIITGDGDSTTQFDLGEYRTVKIKCVTKHKEVEGWLDYEKGIEEASDVWVRPTGKDATTKDDIMFMAFSSGTTGYPKLIMYDFSYPLGHIGTGIFWHRVIDGGLHFTVSDTGWLKCMWGKFYGQWFGETAIFVYDFDKFDGADILSKIEKYKITTFCVPPTMYRLILKEDVSKYDLSSLTHCCSAGEALNADIFNKWKDATGLEIHEGFGQSETTVCVATLYPFKSPTPGIIGRAVPGYDIKLLEEDGTEALPGDVGEICIKATPKDKPFGLFLGYYKDKEANDECWRGGYYHTGDTAYADERGRITYVGRNDDVIKSSGYRIGPFEVESAILEHPSVLEVAVTGVPDPIRGFSVKATIVLREGYKPSTELIKEIQQFVKTNTAPYKYPRIVEFVDALPKTYNGKIRRKAIRETDILNSNDK